MDKKEMMFTKEELRKIVKEIVKEVINENEQLIMEMAMGLDDYRTKCNGNLFNLISHLIKVCLFENVSPTSVNSWRNEIYNYAKPMVAGKIKEVKDKTRFTKRYVYDAYWGEDFEEYDENAIQFFNEVIYEYAHKEDLQRRLFPTVTVKDAVAMNKGRIKRFFDDLLIVSKGSGDLGELRVAVDRFIENKG